MVFADSSTLRRTLFSCLALSCLMIANDLSAQQLANRISTQHGIYFWTDDFESLQLELAKRSKLNFAALDEFLESQLEGQASDETVNSDTQATRQAVQLIVESLAGDELFPSSALLAYTETTRDRGRYCFIAETRFTEEQLRQLFDAIVKAAPLFTNPHYEKPPQQQAMLFRSPPSTQPNGEALDKQLDEDETDANIDALREQYGIHELERELGYWTLKNKCLYWSNDLQSLVVDLNASDSEEGTLAADRSLKLFEQNVPAADQAHLNCFIMPRAMGPLLAFRTYDFVGHLLWTGDWVLIWQVAKLNEIRGFGARLSVARTTKEEHADWAYAIDSMLLMTKPRSGLLSAVRHEDGLQYDMPTSNGKLWRYIEVQLDGRELGEQLTGVRKRIKEDLPEQTARWINSDLELGWHDGYRIDPLRLQEFYPLVSGIAQFYMEQVSEDSEYDRFDANTAWRLPQAQGHLDLLDELRNTEVNTVNDFSEDIELIREEIDQGVIWRVGEEGEKQWADHYEKVIEQWNSVKIRVETSNRRSRGEAPPTEEDLAEIRRENKEFVDRYWPLWSSMLLERTHLFKRGWFMVYPTANRFLDETIDSRLPHPQLVSLKERVNEMRDAFRLPFPLAVYAVWNNAISSELDSLVVESVDEDNQQEVANESNINKDQWLDSKVDQQISAFKTSLQESFSSVVIVASDDTRGFRITGVVVEKRRPSE